MNFSERNTHAGREISKNISWFLWGGKYRQPMETVNK